MGRGNGFEKCKKCLVLFERPQENDLDDSYYGNWTRIVRSFRDKREMAEQKNRLVEEVKGMAKPQTGDPTDGAGKQATGPREDKGRCANPNTKPPGEEEGPGSAREPVMELRRSNRKDAKRGENNKIPGSTSVGGEEVRSEVFGMRTGTGKKAGPNLNENAIAAKNRVDSIRKNSI